jgi:cholesterol transport system auxiliary component
MRTPRIVLTAVLCGLAGCSGIVPSGEQPDIRYFTLEAVRPASSRSPSEGTVLRIRPFRITPRYEGRELVYRMDESQWESDFYNKFFLPPSSLLTEEAAGWLTASGLFENVVSADSYVRSTHVLEVNVTALCGDFRSGEGPAAVLEIQAFLLAIREGAPEVVCHRDIAKRIVLRGATVEDLVEGWNRALVEALGDLEDVIAATDVALAAAAGPGEPRDGERP